MSLAEFWFLGTTAVGFPPWLRSSCRAKGRLGISLFLGDSEAPCAAWDLHVGPERFFLMLSEFNAPKILRNKAVPHEIRVKKLVTTLDRQSTSPRWRAT